MLFKMLYAIANWFYRTYGIIKAKSVIRKLLKVDVSERRHILLSAGFRMISYDERTTDDGVVQIRVYRRNGMKITDKVTILKFPRIQRSETVVDSVEPHGLLSLLGAAANKEEQ